MNKKLVIITSWILILSFVFLIKIELADAFNRAPTCPTSYTPISGKQDILVDQILSWSGASDPDGFIVSYLVYFGTNPSSLALKAILPAFITSYNPGALAYKTNYYWRIVVMDNKLKTKTCSVNSFTTTEPPDTMPPVIQSFSVSPNSVAPGGSFNIQYTVRDNLFLQRIKLLRNNSTIQTRSLSGTYESGSFYDSLTSPGTYQYKIRVYDVAGNSRTSGQASAVVKLADTQGPTLACTPDSLAWANQNYYTNNPIKISASDASGIKDNSSKYKWSYNDWQNFTPSGQNIYFDTNNPSGEYSLNLESEDIFGNPSNKTCQYYKYDNTKPSITGVDTDSLVCEQITWTVTAQDLHSGISEYSFDNGITWQIENFLTESSLIPGQVYIKYIKAKDIAGNTSDAFESTETAVDCMTLAIHNNPPNIPAKQSPIDGSPDIGASVTLQWTEAEILDPDDNFDHYEVWLKKPAQDWQIYADCSNLPAGTLNCNVSVELGLKEYFWNVIAVDSQGAKSHEPSLSP